MKKVVSALCILILLSGCFGSGRQVNKSLKEMDEIREYSEEDKKDFINVLNGVGYKEVYEDELYFKVIGLTGIEYDDLLSVGISELIGAKLMFFDLGYNEFHYISYLTVKERRLSVRIVIAEEVTMYIESYISSNEDTIEAKFTINPEKGKISLSEEDLKNKDIVRVYERSEKQIKAVLEDAFEELESIQ